MRRLVVESAVLLALVIASAFTLSALESQLSLASGAVATMAMLAAATSVAAGFAAEMVARLSEQSSLRRIAAAMMLYGMVVVPTTASGLAATTLDTIVVIAIRHTATLLTITLLLLAVVPFDRPHPWPIRPFRNPQPACAACSWQPCAPWPQEDSPRPSRKPPTWWSARPSCSPAPPCCG